MNGSINQPMSIVNNIEITRREFQVKTRKLSYRKDDRAMRPIYECRENCWESLSMPTVTFPENLMGFCPLFFRLMLWICIQNLKFIALPVPGIIGGTPQNVDNFWIRPRSLFTKLLMAFVLMDPVNVTTKFEFRSFTRSWDNWSYQKCVQSLDTPTLPFHQKF